jgi:hypothetical protein
MNEALAQLRDLHLPPDPAWWPPAPGWWLVALAAALLALALVRHLRAVRRRGARALAQAIGQELARIERQFAEHRSTPRLLQEMSALLRRSAMAIDGPAVAGLSGPAWAGYLAASAPDTDPATWQRVAVGRYRADADVGDPAALLAQCRRWVSRVAP